MGMSVVLDNDLSEPAAIYLVVSDSGDFFETGRASWVKEQSRSKMLLDPSRGASDLRACFKYR